MSGRRDDRKCRDEEGSFSCQFSFAQLAVHRFIVSGMPWQGQVWLDYLHVACGKIYDTVLCGHEQTWSSQKYGFNDLASSNLNGYNSEVILYIVYYCSKVVNLFEAASMMWCDQAKWVETHLVILRYSQTIGNISFVFYIFVKPSTACVSGTNQPIFIWLPVKCGIKMPNTTWNKYTNWSQVQLCRNFQVRLQTYFARLHFFVHSL